MLKQTDSSLVSEWKRLSDLQEGIVPKEEEATRVEKPVINSKKLTVMIRNTVFHFLKSLASRDYETLKTLLSPSEKNWSEKDFENKLAVFYEDHQAISLGPDARSPRNTMIKNIENPEAVSVELIITDPDQHNDWHAILNAKLIENEGESKIELCLEDLGPIG